ncbi:MAG TPA: DUF1800 family protein [Pyrinomonadaceae bacterium]|jgi:uncharacterized protein (DUF1800 family)
MSRLSFVGRRWRTLLVPLGVFLCLISGFNVAAQSPYEDAPILISQPDSTRALTVQPTRGGFGTPVSIFQPGTKTKITVFVTNLKGLLDDEDKTAFRAEFQDAKYLRYPLEIVSFEQTVERKWVYALTVRLNGQLGNVGDVLMRVTWRGMSSNRVRVAIGHEGGKIKDDEGAVPTPMPDEPPAEDFVAFAVGLPWTGDRVRFMEQATFGPKASLESRLRRISYSTWIAEQMEEKLDANGDLRYSTFAYPKIPLMPAAPPTDCDGNPNNVADLPPTCFRDRYSMYLLQRWFYREALYGEDQQLRRRVSWALGQMWVVSGRETVQSGRMLSYLKTLDSNAFGSYRQLMKEMTLNPTMGNYLDMAISTRQSPNENYAREILQLFTIGLYMLNPDGTVKLDGTGAPIPSYDQSIVNGFTKVFTGWSFCELPTAQCPNRTQGALNFTDPMIVINPANHDPGSKQVLTYPGSSSIIPAGQTAEQDLEQAIDNIFHHPNVGPFVGKHLIQQLVTSNPTPAYVKRVAAAFNNNGSGIRGDMKAVIRAVLLDPEARGNIKTDPDYGKLREPVLYVTNFLRPFNPVAQANPVAAENCAGLSDGMINSVTFTLDQDVYNPPSVFNYYPMDYTIPNTPLSGPEFGIFSTGTALKRPNFVHQMIGPGTGGGNGITVVNNQQAANYTPCGTRIDLLRLQQLSTSDPTGAALVDTLNREMMHGAMSTQMRNYIMTAVQAVTANDAGLKRARTAVYLVATAPQFQVQR